jgi:hypothetical protein
VSKLKLLQKRDACPKDCGVLGTIFINPATRNECNLLKKLDYKNGMKLACHTPPAPCCARPRFIFTQQIIFAERRTFMSFTSSVQSSENTLPAFCDNGVARNNPPQPNAAASIFFAELKRMGYQDKEIVAVSSELLNQLTEDIRARLLASSH